MLWLKALLFTQEYVPSELLADVNLGCDSHRTIHNYRVYVATFLGFGSNAAHGRYLDMVLANKTLPVDEYVNVINVIKNQYY